MPFGHIPASRKWVLTNRKKEEGRAGCSRHIRLVHIGRAELVGWALRPIRAGTICKFAFAWLCIKPTLCGRAARVTKEESADGTKLSTRRPWPSISRLAA